MANIKALSNTSAIDSTGVNMLTIIHGSSLNNRFNMQEEIQLYKHFFRR
jgi:hypothetical protein